MKTIVVNAEELQILRAALDNYAPEGHGDDVTAENLADYLATVAAE